MTKTIETELLFPSRWRILREMLRHPLKIRLSFRRSKTPPSVSISIPFEPPPEFKSEPSSGDFVGLSKFEDEVRS